MEGSNSELVRYSMLLRRAVERGDVELALGLLAERERFFAGKSFEYGEVSKALEIDAGTLALLEKKKEELESEINRTQEALKVLRGVRPDPKKRFEVVI